MRAKIIQHPKSSMQNAPLANANWFLEMETDSSEVYADKIMGWTSSNDSNSQVRLSFASLEEAVEYAKSAEIEFEIIETHPKKIVKKSYSDNFK